MIAQEFLERMKTSLSEQKNALLSKTNYTEENIVDCDGDETDAIQANLLMHLNSKLDARNRQAIVKIDAALTRIKESTYGICKDCEEEIPEKRLIVNPYFLTCVSCAEDLELKTKGLK